jgi:putative restriction endonuclease
LIVDGGYSQTARGILVSGIDQLSVVLRRISQLSMALPNTPLQMYHKAIQTERIAEVKQRIGQNIYRKSLLEYWDGACAVTGVSVNEVLKASHAKPWADCQSDDERLSVYNGFLLSANLDALFDKGLISFASDGQVMISSMVPAPQLLLLSISSSTRLRRISPDHEPFLVWHHSRIFRV